ncbi:NECAP-like protein CG9132 isoform X2 [Arctopsyche grandis]|uniref:NECAP-like protein CG9132 isoform X2 n=1 Tax=Arctopsyche grandis TaxID=121162 RepID=UPI00406D6C6C
METYESVVLVKQEVFVFKLPPKANARAHRAADWNLQEPQWTGRMRLVAKGNECAIKLEDKLSGDLFAKCPIDSYPGNAIESVSDSSRYFVLRIQDDNGRAAFIGLGFGDRSDSFDLNVALQDHFKWLKKEKEAERAPPLPEQDFSFKEGETIKINMRITKDGSEGSSKAKARPAGAGGVLLPPPPGGLRIPPPSPQHTPMSVTPTNTAAQSSDWGDYNSASGDNAQTNPPAAGAPATNSNWVQF